MIYLPSAQVILEEDEDDHEYKMNVPHPAARSHTRRERILGLELDDFKGEVPFATFSSTQLIFDDGYTAHGSTSSSRPIPHRSMSGRRSITSLLGKKSFDAQPSRYRQTTPQGSRPSASVRGSSSNATLNHDHAIPPATICYSPPRPSSLYISGSKSTPNSNPRSISPSQYIRAPNPSTSTNTIPSTSSTSTLDASDDLTTYHANLARFKAERAERAAELGVDAFDADRQPFFVYHTRIGDLSSLKIPKRSSIEDRKGSRSSPGLGLGGMGFARGLRAYWGGSSGSSSDIRRPSSSASSRPRISISSRPSSRASGSMDYACDGVVDRRALEEWWDRLGEEPGLEV